MTNKQRTYGQFETPPDIADLLLGFCVRRPSDRLLDPSCGRGAFLTRAAQWQEWLASVPDDASAATLWGVELDAGAAEQARQRLPGAHILAQNFFTLEADSGRLFDAIIGNPPYTRAEWIGRFDDKEQLEQQLAIFDWPEPLEAKPGVSPALPAKNWRGLSRRAGLHAYFFVHGTHFLRDGGRFGFVVTNSWLDVAYGERLKQFLLDHYKIVALVESAVERWFSQARVNACLVVLERCRDPAARAANRVRFIRLRRPVRLLIAFPSHDRQRRVQIERLTARLLPAHDRTGADFAVRVIGQRELAAKDKWGVYLRAPAVYRQRPPESAPLESWAEVQRGFTTGANAFFYPDANTIEKWGLEPEFHRPLLKSLRQVDRLKISRATLQANGSHQVLYIPPTANLAGTAAGDYVAWGESVGFHQRRTCASRQPWYSLPHQEKAHLVLAKGLWERYHAPMLGVGLLVDQQLYQVRLADDVAPLAAAALFNSSWFALQLELHGRVNFGEGVLWLATYELQALHLPDPRRLSPTQLNTLGCLFEQLAQRPVQALETELAQADRQELDEVVFRLMGYGKEEAATLIETLLERLATRKRIATGKL